MIVNVKCEVCGQVLVVIDKDVVSQEDIDMYKASVSCSEHSQTDITVTDIEAE